MYFILIFYVCETNFFFKFFSRLVNTNVVEFVDIYNSSKLFNNVMLKNKSIECNLSNQKIKAGTSKLYKFSSGLSKLIFITSPF